MTSFAGDKIEAYVGPKELGAADNLEDVIINFINEAEVSLDIAVQELDSEKIGQALIEASWRKVDIRMIMEQDYVWTPRAKLPREINVVPLAGETEEQARQRMCWIDEFNKDLQVNRTILITLLRNGIDVKTDYNPKIFHQKYVVRDGRRRNLKRGHPALLTGSTNFTTTDSHTNLNHVIIFHGREVANLYADQFEQTRNGQFGNLLYGSLHSNPDPVNVGGVPVHVLFAPDNVPELTIMKEILKCKHSLDFAIFTFAGSSGLDDAMLSLHQADIPVRGVLDPGQSSQQWSASRWLYEAGIPMYVPRKRPGFRKLHHKLMVIDDSIVIAGSMNYTNPANAYNDENVFVLGSPYDLKPSEGGPVDHDACRAITTFFRTEIDRIIADSIPYVPTHKPSPAPAPTPSPNYTSRGHKLRFVKTLKMEGQERV